MKTKLIQSMSNVNTQILKYNKVNNKVAVKLSTDHCAQVDGFVRGCFSHLCLKGNRKSLTFLLPFHFAKKEGALC